MTLRHFTSSDGTAIRSNEAGIYVDRGSVGLRLFPGDIGPLREYFQRERDEQKPWEGAVEGDVWLLTINGEEEALLFRHDRTFVSRDGDEFAPEEAYITAGRKIWPEPS